jgi:hypothetical protein
MTPRRKSQNYSHYFYSPKKGATVRRRTPVDAAVYDNLAAIGNLIPVQFYKCDAGSRVFRIETRIASLFAATQPKRDARAESVQRCAGAFRVRSTMLLRGGVSSWESNQQRDGVAGQSDLGKKTSLSLFSAVASSSPRAASSPVIGLRSKSTSRAASARLATPISSSQDDRSQTRKLCMRSTALCSPNECRSESNQRQGRNGWGQRPRKTIDRRNGVVSRRVVPRSMTRGARKCAPRDFSSGDGLGIQQPGSMTRGFASLRQPPSGRARDRAMCPAVARFIDRRAA